MLTEEETNDRLYWRPADRTWWADVAQNGEDLAGPFDTEAEAAATLLATVAA
jgi:hypothetical protein